MPLDASVDRSSRTSQAYRRATEFLLDRIDYERFPTIPYGNREMNLQRMVELLDRLGNPHQKIPLIHVAGTKGKGSTVAILTSILAASGLKVGSYTSPHLQSIEERFRMNSVPCPPGDLVDMVEHVRPAVLAMDVLSQASAGRSGPTFFEICTAIAFLYFVRDRADMGVVEVGLGGRLDSTNVCIPIVSVITSISFDHTKQLGNTLTSIATEKAGIIKPGVPVVSGASGAEPTAAIAAIAQARNSPLWVHDCDFHYQYHPPTTPLGLGSFDWQLGRIGDHQIAMKGLELGMVGEHQAANAAVALAALQHVPARMRPSEAAIRSGIRWAQCDARIQVVTRSPTLIVDAAHNVASMEALVRVLGEQKGIGRRRLLLAATKGKDLEGMLRILLPAFDEVHCTQYLKNPRAVEAETLAQYARRVAEEIRIVSGPIRTYDSPAQAWSKLKPLAAPDDLLCVTGSFFIAAEFMEVYGS